MTRNQNWAKGAEKMVNWRTSYYFNRPRLLRYWVLRSFREESLRYSGRGKLFVVSSGKARAYNAPLVASLVGAPSSVEGVF